MPMPYEYDDEAAYQQALAAWRDKKAGGDPFPGPMPQRSAKIAAEAAVKEAGFKPEIRNFGLYQDAARLGANMPGRANPFANAIADQSRAGQLALIAQMRAGLDGPSLAAMQGQRALGQSGQQALGMAAMGGSNPRAAMLQSQQVGGGLAGDLGQARLAEVMRGQGSIGSAAGNLRAGDLQTANAASQAGLQMRGLDDAARRFYAAQGTQLQSAQDRANLELFKLKQRKLLEDSERQMKALSGAMGSTASTLGGLAGA